MPIRAILFLIVEGGLFASIGGGLFVLKGAALALALAAVVTFLSYFEAGPAILRAAGAEEITEDRELRELVATLSARAGIPAPRIFQIAERQPNAFTVGANPGSACLVLTDGIRNRLLRDELAAVIAHELSACSARNCITAHHRPDAK